MVIICKVYTVRTVRLAAWIYFGGGAGVIFGPLFGEQAPEGNLLRRVLLVWFGIVLFARMCFTIFCLLKRKFGWEELGGMLFALFVYQVVFAFIPSLTKHLEARCGEQFVAWTRTTKRYIPFLY